MLNCYKFLATTPAWIGLHYNFVVLLTDLHRDSHPLLSNDASSLVDSMLPQNLQKNHTCSPCGSITEVAELLSNISPSNSFNQSNHSTRASSPFSQSGRDTSYINHIQSNSPFTQTTSSSYNRHTSPSNSFNRGTSSASPFSHLKSESSFSRSSPTMNNQTSPNSSFNRGNGSTFTANHIASALAQVSPSSSFNRGNTGSPGSSFNAGTTASPFNNGSTGSPFNSATSTSAFSSGTSGSAFNGGTSTSAFNGGSTNAFVFDHISPSSSLNRGNNTSAGLLGQSSPSNSFNSSRSSLKMPPSSSSYDRGSSGSALGHVTSNAFNCMNSNHNAVNTGSVHRQNSVLESSLRSLSFQ